MTDFTATKSLFHLPEDMIYLDGNSLGPLPIAAKDRAQHVMAKEWGEMVITGWNRAGWIDMPRKIGDRIAKLIGAPEGSVVLGDTLSIKVYQAVASALELRPERKVILSDSGNFPSDLYMVQGLIASLQQGHELRVLAPEEVDANITDDVAVLMLTEVDYRTGRKHDMKALTKKAHDVGALTVWDLAHSAGALPVELEACDADFAVGCTYKYLNGGPGAPGFIYVKPSLAQSVTPALSGWLGHDAPFAFEQGYRPAPSIDRMRVGTPPIIQLAVLDSALDAWENVDMADLRTKSLALSEQFIAGIEKNCPALELASPRDGTVRGSQISFAFEHGYAAMQAVIARGVIGDFRAPNIMRFGFTPLYIDETDVAKAVKIIADVINSKAYEAPEFQVRNAVT